MGANAEDGRRQEHGSPPGRTSPGRKPAFHPPPAPVWGSETAHLQETVCGDPGSAEGSGSGFQEGAGKPQSARVSVFPAVPLPHKELAPADDQLPSPAARLPCSYARGPEARGPLSRPQHSLRQVASLGCDRRKQARWGWEMRERPCVQSTPLSPEDGAEH